MVLEKLSQRFWLLFIFLFSCISALYIFLSCKTSWFAGMTADGAIYLLLADTLSPFYSFGDGNYQFLMNQYPFPPLYPLMLAFAGGGSGAVTLSYMFTAVVMLLVLLVFYVWNRQLGFSKWLSLFSTVFFSLMPVTLQHLLVIESEHLYLLLTLTGFVCLNRARSGDLPFYLPGILLGLSSLTRTVGIVALAAYALVVWRSHKFTKAILLLMPGLLPLAVWTVYKKVNFEATEYLSSLNALLQGDIVANVLTQVSTNANFLWLFWVGCFDVLRSAHVGLALMLVSGLILTGFFLRLRKLEADAIYISGYLVVILLWPYYAQLERFLFVIMPFLLAFGILGVSFIRAKLAANQTVLSKMLIPSYLLMVSILILSSISSMWGNFNHPLATQDKNLARTAYWLTSTDLKKEQSDHEFMLGVYQSMKEVSEFVPEGDCVISTVPAYLMLHSGRASLKPAPHWVDKGIFENRMQRCEYIYMAALQTHPSIGNPLLYPFERVKKYMQVLSVDYISEDVNDKRVASMLVKYPAD